MRPLPATAAILAAVAAIASLTGCNDREIQVNERPVSIVSETVGAGDAVGEGDLVSINYRILTMDGRELQRMEEYRFVTGGGTVVVGMDEAVRGMRRGGRRTVEVPPHKHWGRKGHGEGENAIPPAARLIFEVELVDVE